MDNYFFKSVVEGKNWIITVLDDDGDEIFHYQFPSFTDDKFTGQLIPDQSLVDLGIMKNTNDTAGLEGYLKKEGYLKEEDLLHSEPVLPGSPEMNAILHGDRIKRAKQSDLVVLPKEITGTNCFNCKFIERSNDGQGFCNNDKVLQNVTERMCCCFWDADGTTRVADDLIAGKNPLQKFEDGGEVYKHKVGDKVRAKVAIKQVPFPTYEEKEVEIIGMELDDNNKPFYRGIFSYKGKSKIGYFSESDIVK